MTFGGPNIIYHQAVERICKQAKEFNIFDNIFTYTEKDLIEDKDFWDKHSKFIQNNSRGYGYWLWKPYLVKKTLEKINSGDILLYLDSGCELNVNGKQRMLELIEIVNKKKIIGTESSSSDYNFTKMDLIKYMNMENDISLLRQSHMQPGAILLLKCEEIVKLYDEYYNIGSNNYHLINDEPSIETNFNDFKEHRHDQSIFNLLVKKYKLINYDMDPTDFGYSKQLIMKNIAICNNYPIWTCRNRSGISFKN